MSSLLLGNQAVAQGLYEAGVQVASSYPGTPSTEITEYAAQYPEIYSEWAPNEKVAVEVAIGASLAGVRAFSAMKHVGLNVAADPLYTASYTGVNAGLVIAVADDPGMHSSQNEQDSRHHAIASKIPMLEPATSQECIDYTKLAYDLSEQFDSPVLLRLTTRISHASTLCNLSPRVEHPEKTYEKNIAKYVMVPGNARPKHVIVEQRTKDLIAWAEENSAHINTTEINPNAEFGVITSGISYQYAKEAFGDKASYLKLGMVNPLPVSTILNFAKQVKKLYVIEELDPIIETHCKTLGLDVIGKEIFPIIGEFSQNMCREKILGETPEGYSLDLNVPVRPPVMCAGCPHRGLYYALKKTKVVVSGDIGCYSLGASAPLSAMDTCICMGASVSAAHGFAKAIGAERGKATVAVIGDSTFMHSGITGLVNVVYNQSNTVTIILDNSITGMTGHQENPTTGKTLKGDLTTSINLEALVKAIGIKHVRVVDPYDLDECLEVVKEEIANPEPSVIISRRPCALLKGVKHEAPLSIDQDKCTGCKMCFQIGCPAISIQNKKAFIDPVQCLGCGQCYGLCKFSAIRKENN